MKQTVSSLLSTLAVVGALSLAACKPRGQEDEAKVSTEVTVQVAKVTRVTLRAHVEAYGTVEPEPAGGGKPAGGARLAAPVASVVLAVPAKEGERVEAGALIVLLDDRVAVAATEKATHMVEFAQQVVERQNKLKAIAGTSEKTFQEAAQQLAAARGELAAAQAQLSLVHLTSPLAGTISRINVQPGQAVDLNTTVAEVVDLSRLTLTAGVPGSEASALKVGQMAEIFTESSDKPVANGSVSFVSPSLDAKTGTALVRVSIPKDASLRPGQFARVRIVSEERAGRLAVPVESVVTDVEGHSVLAVVKGDKAARTPVKLGVRDGGLVEVETEGLNEGDMVVTVGAYGLPKETKVKIAGQ
jgi:membrane fusion protein (multidrug efflux system)